MREGKITCNCGNVFYFQSTREEIPCIKCGKMHPNNGEPVQEDLVDVPAEEVEYEEVK